MVVTKTELFLVTFFSYVSIHSLRTTYSFSKHFLDEALHVDKSAIGTNNHNIRFCGFDFINILGNWSFYACHLSS